uniref:Josephin-2 n=1 Tax=Catharus ustulatus TaxID=91951 RepID=A0A8C3UX40_CATUS
MRGDLGEWRGFGGSGVTLGGLPEFGSGVSGGVYHERQRLELCALHALNNLLQQPWLSKAEADGICRRLSPHSRPNPHRSPLGTGNYDVNVVMAALRTRGLAALWWDRRRPLERLALPQVLGLLLNVPSRVTLGTLALPLWRPHWLGVRQIGDKFWNLDSKLVSPEVIGDESQLRWGHWDLGDIGDTQGVEGIGDIGDIWGHWGQEDTATTWGHWGCWRH